MNRHTHLNVEKNRDTNFGAKKEQFSNFHLGWLYNSSSEKIHDAASGPEAKLYINSVTVVRKVKATIKREASIQSIRPETGDSVIS
jgi:hypothetical protein